MATLRPLIMTVGPTSRTGSLGRGDAAALGLSTVDLTRFAFLIPYRGGSSPQGYRPSTIS
jgi:hypothetical protein